MPKELPLSGENTECMPKEVLLSKNNMRGMLKEVLLSKNNMRSMPKEVPSLRKFIQTEGEGKKKTVFLGNKCTIMGNNL